MCPHVLTSDRNTIEAEVVVENLNDVGGKTSTNSGGEVLPVVVIALVKLTIDDSLLKLLALEMSTNGLKEMSVVDEVEVAKAGRPEGEVLTTMIINDLVNAPASSL